MRRMTKEIPKEIYDKCKNGKLPKDCYGDVFSKQTVIGYGVYSTDVYEDNGKYYLDYLMGDSCD